MSVETFLSEISWYSKEAEKEQFPQVSLLLTLLHTKEKIGGLEYNMY